MGGFPVCPVGAIVAARPAISMNDPVPVSRNELERLLFEFQDGALAPDEFGKRLLDMQVFMPIRDEKHAIRGFQASTKAQPLLVESEDGFPVLTLFSSPDRARQFVAGFEGHGGGIMAEFSWVLRRMGAEMGISINPGADPGFDLDPDMVRMLFALLPEQAE
jgi:hypothetical protein